MKQKSWYMHLFEGKLSVLNLDTDFHNDDLIDWIKRRNSRVAIEFAFQDDLSESYK